jgi:TolA-binding protein
MRRYHKFILLSLVLIMLSSCAYYNTFYNAEQYFAEAQKVTHENQLDQVSKEELTLYSKAIEKSKKLLQKYPDSKYRDDAQFLIARAYYYKGDYLISQKHFELLALEYGSSPFANEVPLWIGRCLLKVGDIAMARHEATRVINGSSSRSLKADALLMMGEIAVQQDSIELAEAYLVRVIDTSPDGLTKAKAQFQVGKMRENQEDYEGALAAYKSVNRYKPSESMKVDAIIRQTSMLKALNLDAEAVEMIQDMLLSDKFVEIRGQLEVELGKLYITIDKLENAETNLRAIIENYSRQAIAAEASFVLGELYLINKLDYQSAHEAFKEVKVQSVRSPFVKLANQRLKQIERYIKIQSDHVNYQRQLAGLPPIVKKKESKPSQRAGRSSRSRGRGGAEAESDLPSAVKPAAKKKKVEKEPAAVEAIEPVDVSPEDSVRFLDGIDENRYSMAEYMLFEFSRVDTTLEVLKDLESSTRDSSLKRQAAYMQYYALGTVEGDQVAADAILSHIQDEYPEYYKLIQGNSGGAEIAGSDDHGLARLQEIAQKYEAGLYKDASSAYLKLRADQTVSPSIRVKASFNYALLNNHFLYDKDASIEAYKYMIQEFPDEPLTLSAKMHLDLITAENISKRPPREETPDLDEEQEDEESKEKESKRSQRSKQNQKDK